MWHHYMPCGIPYGIWQCKPASARAAPAANPRPVAHLLLLLPLLAALLLRAALLLPAVQVEVLGQLKLRLGALRLHLPLLLLLPAGRGIGWEG